MHLSPSRRSGFSVADLVVVSAMSTVFVAVALPLVQDAREEARRVACANRLIELTQGSFEYEEANNRMPPFQTGPGPVASVGELNTSSHQNTGALAYILPFIGEADLLVDTPKVALQPDVFLGSGAPLGNFGALLNEENWQRAIETQFPSVICPSNASYLDKPADRLFYQLFQDESLPDGLWVASFDLFFDSPTAFGRSSYVPSIGGFHVGTETEDRAVALSTADVAGAMRNRTTSIRAEDLGDGASNTICWSESLGYGLQQDIVFQNDTVGVNFALHSTALITGNSWTIGLDPETGEMQSRYFGDSENSYPWLIGSNHIDGSNVTFCDGSVRFISNRTSRGVMSMLGCGNDGWVTERTK